MNNDEERLQELLERLEAGVPVSNLLSEATAEDAALVQLAATLREIGAVERDRTIVAAQRTQMLEEARVPGDVPVPVGLNGTTAQAAVNASQELPQSASQWVTARLRAFFARLQHATSRRQARPVLILGGIGLVVLLLIFIKDGVDQTPAGETLSAVPLASPESDAVPDAGRAAGNEAKTDSDGRKGAGTGAAAMLREGYLPMVAMQLVRAPGEATISGMVGLVEVQTADGNWTPIDGPYRLVAGQRLRTGALSRASLAFYDGSVAHLGPDSELSIDALNANPQDVRHIVLTQWRGESEHEVAQVRAEDRIYRVNTPDGSGEATGTAFQVRVVPGVQSFFSVLHGSINVASVNVTVAVTIGQLVIVKPDQPPMTPTFRITGEGEVTAMGDTWIIGGQMFTVGDDTVIADEVAIGDYVSVEGHLAHDGTSVADRIVVVGRPVTDKFTISGEVTAIDAAKWTVAGQTISVDDDTAVEAGVVVGSLVGVEGRILDGGQLLATNIYLLDDSLPFTFTAIVETIGVDTWTVSGVPVAVNEETGIDPGVEVGDVVMISGYLEEGEWVATNITLAPDQANTFSFAGLVETVDPWTVAGISFEIREWTVIDEGIEIGDRVRVSGRILDDGTRVALSILLVDDDALTTTFIGIVDSSDPWIVSGLSLVTDEDTIVDSEVDVGDLVLVRARRLDGEWLALLIAGLDEAEPFVGCFAITAHIVDWANGELILDGWPNIDLGADVDLAGLVEFGDALGLDEGESIEDVLDGSMANIYICFLPDDEVVVTKIIIIFIVGDEVPPPPPPPPPSTEAGKVTVCHKAGKNQHTIVIDRSALSAHLGHGDYRGACR